MRPPELDAVRERLLDAGVLPRRARRLVEELHDHWLEATHEFVAEGLREDRARARALGRLGTEDALVAAALSAPGAVCLSRRRPALVFGIGPIASALTLLVLLLALGMVAGGSLRHASAQHFAPIARTWWAILTYAPWPAALLAFHLLAHSRRVPRRFTHLAAAALAALAAPLLLRLDLTAAPIAPALLELGLTSELHLVRIALLAAAHVAALAAAPHRPRRVSRG